MIVSSTIAVKSFPNLIPSKASSASLPSIAHSCGVLLTTPQLSLLGALHLTLLVIINSR